VIVAVVTVAVVIVAVVMFFAAFAMRVPSIAET